MLADEVDYVVGVDTHRDQHVLAVVVASSGGVIAQRSVRSNARGYAEAMRFAGAHAPGARVWAVEGAGHYGAGFARYLSGRGETVHEVSRTARGERRLQGKDDLLDAIRVARSALASTARALPRSGERQEALRLLLLARRSAVDVRRVAIVQLRSVIVTAPESLRDELRQLPLGELLRRCSRFRRSSSRTPDELAIILVLRSLARRIEAATEEASRARAGDPRPRPRTRARAAQRGRRRPDRRRPTDRHLVTPRSRPQRSSIRSTGRRRTPARLKRPDDPASPQPRRRPATQPRPPHRHPPPPPPRPRHPRLHRPTRRRRQKHTRRNPDPQALPRPPPLPRHAEREPNDDLTVIGDSFPNSMSFSVEWQRPVAGADSGRRLTRFRMSPIKLTIQCCVAAADRDRRA